MEKRLIFIFPSILFLFLLSCSRIPSVKYAVHRPPPPTVQIGVASWYGPNFHGRRTASGEIYNMYDLTAAHPTLPLGTYVEVTNLENDRSVRVRINDRGPFIKGRILDLSYAAARALDMVNKGTARVRIEVLGRDRRPHGMDAFVPPFYTLQVGSFAKAANALKLEKELQGRYPGVYIIPFRMSDYTVFRVRLGVFRDRKGAALKAKELAREGYTVLITTLEP